MAREPARGGFRRWLARALATGLAFVLVFIAGAAAMHLGMHAGDRERIQSLQDNLASQQAESARLLAEADAARNEAEIQAATQRVLQEKLAGLQQQLGQVRDQLAFYEQLIPPGPAGALAIRAFDIQADGDFLRYRVLLTRNAAPDAQPFKGRMRFVAEGLRQDKTVKMELGPPQVADPAGGTESAPADPLALVFDQFQRGTGVLQVPSGVQIRSVRLEILEGETVRATQDAVLNRAAPAAQESQP